MPQAVEVLSSNAGADGRPAIIVYLPAVLFAYLLGGVIAFVAGAIVAVAALWRQPTFVTIIVATLIANVGCYVAIPDALFQSLSTNLAVSAFAATICWLLFRRLLSNP